MGSTKRITRNGSFAKVCCGFIFLVAISIGLMDAKTEGFEMTTGPAEAQPLSAATADDVLSGTDLHQWRQEFLWHRNLNKVCPNAWLDGETCVRTSQQL